MTAEQIAQLVIEPDTASAAAAVEVRCAGAWTVQGIPQLEQRLETLSWPGEGDLVIDGAAISALDTAGAWLLHRTIRALEQRGRNVRINGLRLEFSALLQLIAARAVMPVPISNTSSPRCCAPKITSSPTSMTAASSSRRAWSTRLPPTGSRRSACNSSAAAAANTGASTISLTPRYNGSSDRVWIHRSAGIKRMVI